MIGLPIGTVHEILSEDLKISRICAKFVTKILSSEMKERRKTVAQEMLHEVENDPDFLSKLVKGDELWIYSYNHQTKMQSSQWRTRHVSTLSEERLHGKISHEINVDLLFWYRRGCLVRIFTSRCDGEFRILQRCADKIVWSHPKKKTWKWKHGWLLHHDNAPCHTSFRILNFLASTKLHMGIILHIHPTRLHAIFRFSLSWKQIWNQRDSNPSRKFRPPCWGNCACSLRKIFGHVLRHSGWNDGGIASRAMELTLNVIKFRKNSPDRCSSYFFKWKIKFWQNDLDVFFLINCRLRTTEPMNTGLVSFERRMISLFPAAYRIILPALVIA